MFEETHYAIVELNTHVIAIFFQAKWAEVEVLEPVIIDFLCDRGLHKLTTTKSYDSMILQSSIQADHR